MSDKYIIISLFGHRSIVSEEKRNAFLKVIYDGVTINRPKCFEKFINNTKNKLWMEMRRMKFYTSDLHFDHSNVLEYEHRPWKNVEEMNEGLLFRINTRVGVNDELYILGDFTLRSTRNAVEKLRNGIICNHVHLITGNHDCFAKRAWASELFETIQPYKEIRDEGHKLILCHYPILYWNGMDDDEHSIHLYGHMHSRKDMQHPHKDAYNVGVDVNDWYPVTLKELLERRLTK